MKPFSVPEVKALWVCGRILAQALRETAQAVRPGISTAKLNTIAESSLRRQGATPSFLGYGEKKNPFPATLCTSVNSAVVHGIPNSAVVLSEGDIIGLDLGCWYQGVCTDAAITVPVGNINKQAQKLIRVTEASLLEALKQLRSGTRVGDIGAAVQEYVETNGFSVVRALTGHGVGHAVHEGPAIPNFGKVGTGVKFIAGQVVAIEPMVNEGVSEVEFLDDGWSVVTADGKLSAHFEHTVLVTERGCEILTQF